MTQASDIHYEDTGCEVAPKCLKCPLPVCKYDHPAAMRLLQRQWKDAEIMRAINSGLSVQQTAKQFSLTAHTIRRVITRTKNV
jgi:DNA-binding NarL/FixJ family response regulator